MDPPSRTTAGSVPRTPFLSMNAGSSVFLATADHLVDRAHRHHGRGEVRDDRVGVRGEREGDGVGREPGSMPRRGLRPLQVESCATSCAKNPRRAGSIRYGPRAPSQKQLRTAAMAMPCRGRLLHRELLRRRMASWLKPLFRRSDRGAPSASRRPVRRGGRARRVSCRPRTRGRSVRGSSRRRPRSSPRSRRWRGRSRPHALRFEHTYREVEEFLPRKGGQGGSFRRVCVVSLLYRAPRFVSTARPDGHLPTGLPSTVSAPTVRGLPRAPRSTSRPARTVPPGPLPRWPRAGPTASCSGSSRSRHAALRCRR